MIGRNRSYAGGSRTTSRFMACRFTPISSRSSTSCLDITHSGRVSYRYASTRERQRYFTKSRFRSFELANESAENRARVIGILTALGWAFFVPAQAYSVILMPTAAGVFVFWFLVWQIIKSEYAPSPRRCLAYGALVGVTAMGIATILFLRATAAGRTHSQTAIRSRGPIALARP